MLDRYPLSDTADKHQRRAAGGALLTCTCGQFRGNELAWRGHREQELMATARSLLKTPDDIAEIERLRNDPRLP